MANALSTILDPDNPDLKPYRQQAPELVATANALTIETDADLAEAGELVRTSSAAMKAIKALFQPAKQSLDLAKKQIMSLEASLVAGFANADSILRAKIVTYNVRRRREEDARVAAEREAERKRREDEQLAQAVRLEDLGRVTGEEHYHKAADLVLSQPIRPPVIAPTVPKTKGITLREETGVDVYSIVALARAVIDGAVDGQAILPNVAWLRAEATQRGTAVKDGDELFPGVRVTKTPDITVRTR